MQLYQEAGVSAQIRNTDLAGLSRTLGNNKERNSLMVSAEESAEKILRVTAVMNDIKLPLNDYNVSRIYLERKPLNKMLF